MKSFQGFNNYHPFSFQIFNWLIILSLSSNKPAARKDFPLQTQVCFSGKSHLVDAWIEAAVDTLTFFCLGHWFSNCGPQTSNSRCTGDFSHFRVPARLTESETQGWGPAICEFTSPPGDSDVPYCWRTTAPGEEWGMYLRPGCPIHFVPFVFEFHMFVMCFSSRHTCRTPTLIVSPPRSYLVFLNSGDCKCR